MILIGPIVLAILFALPSVWVCRSGDSLTARSRSLWVTLLALFVALTFTGFQTQLPLSISNISSLGVPLIAPLVTAFVAVIAVGLAPAISHSPSTFAAMLLLFGFAEAFLSTDHPIVLLTLWALSSFVVWFEFKSVSTGDKWHRVLGLYQLASVVAFSFGVLLLWRANFLGYGLLLLAIGVREGILPFQSWFPGFVERAPMGLVVAFLAPQLGVCAHFVIISGHDIGLYSAIIAILGASTAVLAAMLGSVQTKPKRAIAYLILSQTGLVAFGLESTSEIGQVGALLNWQILALAVSGFAMTYAIIEARRGALFLSIPNGNFSETPRLASSFLLLGFASVGFPLTFGFVAEELLVQGNVSDLPFLAMSLVFTTALNGITVAKLFFFLFTGSKNHFGIPDLLGRERFVLGVAIASLVVFGVAPGPLVSFEDATFRLQRKGGEFHYLRPPKDVHPKAINHAVPKER